MIPVRGQVQYLCGREQLLPVAPRPPGVAPARAGHPVHPRTEERTDGGGAARLLTCAGTSHRRLCRSRVLLVARKPGLGGLWGRRVRGEERPGSGRGPRSGEPRWERVGRPHHLPPPPPLRRRRTGPRRVASHVVALWGFRQ